VMRPSREVKPANLAVCDVENAVHSMMPRWPGIRMPAEQ
jgi:hypothetical protein